MQLSVQLTQLAVQLAAHWQTWAEHSKEDSLPANLWAGATDNVLRSVIVRDQKSNEFSKCDYHENRNQTFFERV